MASFYKKKVHTQETGTNSMASPQISIGCDTRSFSMVKRCQWL